MMTVGDLKELLEGLDDEVEVRTMSQFSWPFENRIQNAVLSEDLPDFTPEGKAENELVLYLTEGTQLAYGTKDAWL